MTAQNFAAVMAAELVYEGGKVDNPKDPGGRTNQGVTQRVYDGWRLANGLRKRDVYAMIADERDAIYRLQYWDAIKGDYLPSGVDLTVMDGGVNSGVSRGSKWLQLALGVTADGAIGSVTLGAALGFPDHDALITDVLNRRMNFLRGLSTWPAFGKGWTSRVDSVRSKGQAWASGSVGPDPVKVADADVRPPEDVHPDDVGLRRPTLREGSGGGDVRVWQTVVGVVADSVFGQKTRKATVSWQAEHRLKADGIVGPKTWEAAAA